MADVTFNCRWYAPDGSVDQGIGKIGILGYGEPLNNNYAADTGYIGLLGLGTNVLGGVISDTTGYIGLEATGTPYIIPSNQSFVWTSRIGQFSFTKDPGGEVSKRPMPWRGWVYAIKKIGNRAVVYCQNGIVMMTRNGLVWDPRTIHTVGLLGKDAVVAVGYPEPKYHVFIDKQGMLGRIFVDGTVKMIDYSNYFVTMSAATVLSWNPEDGLIYICDGTSGYVLSEEGLGKGPINITGIGAHAGTIYAATVTGTITFDPLHECTDTLDFGTREEKTIYGLDIGTTVTNDLYAAIDYRWQKGDSFTTSPWVKVDPKGRANVYVQGTEFRVRVKLLTYEAIQVDYINVLIKVGDLKPMGNA